MPGHDFATCLLLTKPLVFFYQKKLNRTNYSVWNIMIMPDKINAAKIFNLEQQKHATHPKNI